MNLYEKYNFAVRYKVNQFLSHPLFEKFKNAIERDLQMRTGFGLDAIISDTRTDLIILRSIEEITDWLDGKQSLGFTDEEKQNKHKFVNAAYEKIYTEHYK